MMSQTKLTMVLAGRWPPFLLNIRRNSCFMCTTSWKWWHEHMNRMCHDLMNLLSRRSTLSIVFGTVGNFRFDARTATGVKEVAPSRASWFSRNWFSSATNISPKVNMEMTQRALSTIGAIPRENINFRISSTSSL